VIPSIHAITSDRVIAQGDFVERARGVMGTLGARGAVHLRSRLLSGARLYELAVALGPLQERTGCWVVVSDRLDVGLAAGAAAAQLTTRSIAVRDARRLAPTFPLGASVHAADEAAAAERDGATWVVAGHVFRTASHPGDAPRGARLVAEVAARVRIPCIAIGGVRPEHVAALRRAGAHGVAAISGIWGERDAERAARRYLSACERDHDS